jgi:hypothetical protein
LQIGIRWSRANYCLIHLIYKERSSVFRNCVDFRIVIIRVATCTIYIITAFTVNGALVEILLIPVIKTGGLIECGFPVVGRKLVH